MYEYELEAMPEFEEEYEYEGEFEGEGEYEGEYEGEEFLRRIGALVRRLPFAASSGPRAMTLGSLETDQ